MSKQIQLPILPGTPVQTEPLEPEIVEITIDDILDSSDDEILPDIKEIYRNISKNIVPHILCEDSIKSETVSEDTYSGYDVSKGTYQGVVKVESPYKNPNASNNLNIDEQLVLNFCYDLNGNSIHSRKSECPKETDSAECYGTCEATSGEKDKEKTKIIKAPVHKVKPQKYTSFQCLECPYISTNKSSLRCHITLKHIDAKHIQWFESKSCDKKFKFKHNLDEHTLVHLTKEQRRDRVKLCPVCRKQFKTSVAVIKHVKYVHRFVCGSRKINNSLFA